MMSYWVAVSCERGASFTFAFGCRTVFGQKLVLHYAFIYFLFSFFSVFRLKNEKKSKKEVEIGSREEEEEGGEKCVETQNDKKKQNDVKNLAGSTVSTTVRIGR